jgi:hypothetical protein
VRVSHLLLHNSLLLGESFTVTQGFTEVRGSGPKDSSRSRIYCPNQPNSTPGLAFGKKNFTTKILFTWLQSLSRNKLVYQNTKIHRYFILILSSIGLARWSENELDKHCDP